MFTDKDYRTRDFIKINNLLGTEELNRKQGNVTQEKQYLPIKNKVKTHSNNQVQNTVNLTSS
jgi:hypothetical protein